MKNSKPILAAALLCLAGSTRADLSDAVEPRKTDLENRVAAPTGFYITGVRKQSYYTHTTSRMVAGSFEIKTVALDNPDKPLLDAESETIAENYPTPRFQQMKQLESVALSRLLPDHRFYLLEWDEGKTDFGQSISPFTHEYSNGWHYVLIVPPVGEPVRFGGPDCYGTFGELLHQAGFKVKSQADAKLVCETAYQLNWESWPASASGFQASPTLWRMNETISGDYKKWTEIVVDEEQTVVAMNSRASTFIKTQRLPTSGPVLAEPPKPPYFSEGYFSLGDENKANSRGITLSKVGAHNPDKPLIDAALKEAIGWYQRPRYDPPLVKETLQIQGATLSKLLAGHRFYLCHWKEVRLRHSKMGSSYEPSFATTQFILIVSPKGEAIRFGGPSRYQTFGELLHRAGFKVKSEADATLIWKVVAALTDTFPSWDVTSSRRISRTQWRNAETEYERVRTWNEINLDKSQTVVSMREGREPIAAP